MGLEVDLLGGFAVRVENDALGADAVAAFGPLLG